MDLLSVQLIQDNHPLPLPLWNIPVYSGSRRIRGDQQDSVDGTINPDPGPYPNLGLKIIGVLNIFVKSRFKCALVLLAI
jgi:hypothetical protein